MTGKHTPGPWAIKEYNNGHTGEHGLHGIFREKDVGAQHCPIVEKVWGCTLDQSDANARLIAAAPEMLAALKACAGELVTVINAAGDDEHPVIAGHIKVLDRARAAIAKAEARS